MFLKNLNLKINLLEDFSTDYLINLNDEDFQDFLFHLEFLEVYWMLMLMLINELIFQYLQIMFQLMDIDLFQENLIVLMSKLFDLIHFYFLSVNLFYHLIKLIHNDDLIKLVQLPAKPFC